MIRIRKATLEDAAIVSRIVCLCYEGFGQTDNWSNDVIIELNKSRGSAKHIRELIANEDMFVADDEGRINGMVSIKDNEITKLYIDPHYQRKGIGKQLFIRAQSFIRSHGYQEIFLGAAVQTPHQKPSAEQKRDSEQIVPDIQSCEIDVVNDTTPLE